MAGAFGGLVLVWEFSGGLCAGAKIISRCPSTLGALGRVRRGITIEPPKFQPHLRSLNEKLSFRGFVPPALGADIGRNGSKAGLVN
jgi:hypothetical protein